VVALMPAVLAPSGAAPVAGQLGADRNGWRIEVSGGVVTNLPSTLSIRQSGEPDIVFDADFRGEPLTPPVYYSIRIGRWSSGRAWEFELIHEKIFLSNQPAEVQKYEISHGFNLVTVNHVWAVRWAMIRVGIGAVLAHPEIVVRGRETNAGDGRLEGYVLAGPTAQITLARKVAASRATVPVAGGHSVVRAIGFHGLMGVRYGW
jgi:hypothetical protein